MSMRRNVWRCMLAYTVIAWSSIALTAFGVTGWTWGVAFAPLWVPGGLMLMVLVIADVWFPVRALLRAMRRRWYAVRRTVGRIA